jgi:hypothetical protein
MDPWLTMFLSFFETYITRHINVGSIETKQRASQKKIKVWCVFIDCPENSRKSSAVAEYMNLKIKPAQFFGGVYKSRVCMCVFIGISAHMCISICVCTVFLKKSMLFFLSSRLRKVRKLAEPSRLRVGT